MVLKNKFKYNTSRQKINQVTNRFLPLCPSVSQGYEPEPKFQDFTVLKEIGKGSFGSVYLATHRITKKQYAIKAIDKRNKAIKL